jgi:hypothetical protein
MEKKELMKTLAMIGGIVGLIEAIVGFFFAWGWGYGVPYLNPIIGLILSILVLLSVFRPGNPIPYNAIVLIIFGILMIIFASFLGGILVLVGGILGYLK